MSEYLTIDPGRQVRLKEIIARLHKGEKASVLKREFASLIEGVSASEIAAMEQSLLNEGFPVEEIQRLCEVHVEVFKSTLEKGGRPAEIPGHPIHTMLAENRQALLRSRNLVRLARAARWGADNKAERAAALEDLAAITIHYARKENQLFPFLERHGFTGPGRVMWAKHDETRTMIREARAALELDAGKFAKAVSKLTGAIRKMIFMEEHILFPDAAGRLSAEEWARVRSGEDAIGYAWVRPEALYDAGLVSRMPSRAGTQTKDAGGVGAGAVAPAEAEAAASTQETAIAPATASGGETLLNLNVGTLPLGILDLALRRLPIDFSIVDDQDRVLYYSDAPHRIFPRSPAVIGRSVQNCHPQRSVATVNRILDSFKKKEKNHARFWIDMGGKMIVIEYYALYDSEGVYKGTLEVSQDATELRALEGQRRLLDWE